MLKQIKKTDDYMAKVALIQCGVKKFNDCVYSAPSATDAKKTHYLTVVEGQVTYCSECKGFKFYGDCAHATAVLGYIEEEQRKAAEQAVKAAEGIVGQASTVPSIRRGYNTRPEIRWENGIPMR